MVLGIRAKLSIDYIWGQARFSVKFRSLVVNKSYNDNVIDHQ